MTAQPDAREYSARTRAAWDECAEGWDGNTARIRPWLADATERMLAAAGVSPGAGVLDVAAGAGDQTIDAARRVGTTGRVVATDLSPTILALAARNAARAGLDNVRTCVADAEALPLDDGAPLGDRGSFDSAISRLGLMFCLSPRDALAGMHRALKPGGRAATIVFSSREANPCIATLLETAFRHAGVPPIDPYRPGGLLSLGRPGAMTALFEAAGFRDVRTTALQAPYRLPSARDYVDFVRSAGTPIVKLLAVLPPERQRDAWDDMVARLDRFGTDDGWVGPHELLLTSGVKDGAGHRDGPAASE